MRYKNNLLGRPCCYGHAEGLARVVSNPIEEAGKFKEGEILVVQQTTPDYTTMMYLSSGVIGEVNSVLSHLAIVTREANIPCIIGVNNATKRIKTGDKIVMDAAKGIISQERDLIYPLNSELCADATRFGSKIANLSRIMNKGFLVPGGYAIDSSINDILKDKYKLEIIESVLAEANLPDGKLWAVRSSGLAEDSSKNSFAGQNETYLNTEKKDISNNVLKVIESNQSDRSKVYAQKNNVDDNSVAVLVQEMVKPQIAGVMFMKNPVSNDEKEVMIEIVNDFGDKLVSGMISPTSYVLDKNNKKIKEVYAGESKVNIAEIQLEELLKTGSEIDRLLNQTSDIEFAYSEGLLYILQARPITSK